MKISNTTLYYPKSIRKTQLNEQPQNVQVQSFEKTNPAFTSWSRTVYLANEFGQKTRFPKNCQDTWIYRGNAKKFVKFIHDWFKDAPKINFYNFGCSNGSEAFTYVMEMDSNYEPEFLKKCTPIIARDIEPIAIKYAYFGEMELEKGEVESIVENTNGNMDKYFKLAEGEDLSDKSKMKHWYEVNPILNNHVDFQVGDALEEIEKIEPENTIVTLRNFWPYLNLHKRKELAQKAYDRLGDNGLVAIAKFDNNPFDLITADSILREVGFKPTECEYVYSKR